MDKPNDHLLKRARKLAERYCITDGQRFRLKDHDPGDTADLKDADKPAAVEALHKGVELLASLQDKLYADNRWSLLLIFQAMDAAGKDSAIKHVMSGINPQGCSVVSFKAPSAEELDHDFLWRCQRHAPQRGQIGIFNRSYYEEVLVVRVHPEILARQRIPPTLTVKGLWEHRFRSIRAYEKHLARSGTLVRKFFLNVSKKEQKKRFLARIDNPEKNWKFSADDVRERGYWKDYMRAYQDMIQNTATDQAPWYVVPADNKWFTRIVVADAIIDALAGMDLRYPQLDPSRLKELAEARKQLVAEGR